MLQFHRGVAATENRNLPRRHSPPETSVLDLEFAHLSDCGRVRTHNEDYLGYVIPMSPLQVQTQGWLFALADGVGGHERGEVASRTAVESLLGNFRTTAGGDLHTTLLPRLVQEANLQVYETGRTASPGGVGMATTLVVCALRFDRAVVAHVGDSRCYLIRRGRANLLTRDHTVASEHARLGLLSPQEAAEASTRHLLTRSLGTELFVGVETSDHQVTAGDVLLLCCDGLHGAVRASEMAHLTSQYPDLNTVAQKLVALANQRDGSDNISVLLIRVRSVERAGMYRGRPYKLR